MDIIIRDSQLSIMYNIFLHSQFIDFFYNFFIIKSQLFIILICIKKTKFFNIYFLALIYSYIQPNCKYPYPNAVLCQPIFSTFELFNLLSINNDIIL